MSTASKIKVKLGQMEVEYEGSDAFIKEELEGFLTRLSTIQSKLTSSPGSSTTPIANANYNRLRTPPSPEPFDESAVFNF